MKRSRFTDSQIMDALKRAEAGVAVPELCRELGISSATFYKWRSKYGGMDVSLMRSTTVRHPELTSVLSKQGRITVPRELRKRLGLRPGTVYQFALGEDGTLTIRFDKAPDDGSSITTGAGKRRK